MNTNYNRRSQFVAALMASLLVAGPAFAATLKKTVAVSRFENKTAWKGQVSLDDGMADQLCDSLIQSKQFIVLERQTLGDVTAEQDLAGSGRAVQSKVAVTGKLLSAQVLVKGTVTEFENKSASSGTGVSFGGVSLGNKREEAHVGLIIRLIDTTTGQVLDSQRVEGKAQSGGMSVGVNVAGVGFGTEGFKKTPLGKAMQIAIDNAVEYIAKRLQSVPFSGRVIKADEDDIYINAGSRAGTQVGDTFLVSHPGEALVDPTTGETLGSEEKKRGMIKVYDVQEKFSKAKPEGKLAGEVKPNDIIRATQ